jgi:hypothetical protein
MGRASRAVRNDLQNASSDIVCGLAVWMKGSSCRGPGGISETVLLYAQESR